MNAWVSVRARVFLCYTKSHDDFAVARWRSRCFQQSSTIQRLPGQLRPNPAHVMMDLRTGHKYTAGVKRNPTSEPRTEEAKRRWSVQIFENDQHPSGVRSFRGCSILSDASQIRLEIPAVSPNTTRMELSRLHVLWIVVTKTLWIPVAICQSLF